LWIHRNLGSMQENQRLPLVVTAGDGEGGADAFLTSKTQATISEQQTEKAVPDGGLITPEQSVCAGAVPVA
jgi:hypothetical protein